MILGNALGGEKHYQASLRIRLPEILKRLEQSATLATLAPDTREHIIEETRRGYLDNVFTITEDTMPGELANVIAGRVANLLNLRGMNYTTDAACASGLAALNSAVTGLGDHQFDAVVPGGITRPPAVRACVQLSTTGALSAPASRPSAPARRGGRGGRPGGRRVAAPGGRPARLSACVRQAREVGGTGAEAAYDNGRAPRRELGPR